MSAITTQTFLDESDFEDIANSYCRNYSESTDKTTAVSGELAYKAFSLGGNDQRSRSRAVAEDLCRSDNRVLAKDNAYASYVRRVAPEAYDSYNRCIQNDNRELFIEILSGTERSARIRVAYRPTRAGSEAALIADYDDEVTCNWRSGEQDSSDRLVLESGESVILRCSRTDSSVPSAITVLDETSTLRTSFATLPWSAYETGVPVSLETQYVDAIGSMQGFMSSIQGAVVPFVAAECPQGWREYAPAHGRFIRGIDRSGQDIDPDGEREPGSLQTEDVGRHTHLYQSWNPDMRPSRAGNAGEDRFNALRFDSQVDLTAGYDAGVETRPDNVALLYCERL